MSGNDKGEGRSLCRPPGAARLADSDRIPVCCCAGGPSIFLGMPHSSASPRRGFASDNFAGIHPSVLEAIVAANVDHARAYGGDEHTASATARCREHFGPDVEVAFVFNGTGANVLSLASAMQSHHAVICSEYAHIYLDECGAPE